MSDTPSTASHLPVPDDVPPGLVRGLRASDRQAFAAIYQHLHAGLLRYAWQFTKDPHAAADVVQDVFVKLWAVRANLDPDRSVRSFLYTMTRNRALNHARARRTQASPVADIERPSTDGTESADGTFEATALEQRLLQWVQEMPERRREAFLLSRVQGLTHEEIARVMQLTPRTVNTHIVLALNHLRQRLAAHHTPRPLEAR